MASKPTTKDFFKALYGEIGEGESIEIRAKYRSQTKRIQCNSPEMAVQAAMAYKAGEVFFGVALRDGQGGKKANVTRITTAWADLDAKPDILDCLTRIRTSPLPPSAMIASGMGLHCYWFLDQPLGRDGIPRIEKLNKLIAAAIGGDTVHDAARILRVPGTVNRKYDQPCDVVILGLDADRRYTIEHMCDQFREQGTGNRQQEEPAQIENRRLEIENVPCLPCRREMWRGVDEGARNNAAFQLAIDLKRDGLPGPVAFAALKDWNGHNRPPMEIRTLGDTVKSVYTGDYKGLGCEKKPMEDMCSSDCPVRRVESQKSKVESSEEPDPITQAPTPVTCLPLLKAWELAEVAMEEVDWLVDGLVPARGVTMFTGEGGIGKSFIVMDLALAVARGEEFLGHFACKQGPVMIVDVENDQGLLGYRLKKVGRGRGDDLDGADVSVVNRSQVRPELLQIDTPTGLAWVDGSVAAVGARLLVIDPMVAIHGCDENNNVQMRAVMMGLDNISQKHGCAVVLVHHTRKRGEINDAGQRMRGASDLRNAVVSHVAFRKAGGSKRRGVLISAEQDKCRPAESVLPFAIEMTDSEDGAAVHLRWAGETSDTSSGAGSSKTAEAREMILELLTEQGACGRKELMERATSRGCSDSTVIRAIRLLHSEGSIIKTGHGTYELQGGPEE